MKKYFSTQSKCKKTIPAIKTTTTITQRQQNVEVYQKTSSNSHDLILYFHWQRTCGERASIANILIRLAIQ